MFTPKSDAAAEQQLKVQRLVIKQSDPSMYLVQSSSTYILIKEPLDEVYLASFKDDSANTSTLYNHAQISIVDSGTLTTGGTSGVTDPGGVPTSDRQVISLPITAVDANDCIIVEYTVLQHL